MKWLDRLERRFGRYALPNLTLGIIAVQGLAFLATVSNPALLQGMWLDTQMVRQGEWWRLLTFMMMPPSGNVLWVLLAFYVLYLTGGGLEAEIGRFRYNLYWLVGYLASVGFAFAVPGTIVSNAFLTTSVFLAFAVLYPDFEFLLFLILPVKVKWLALIAWLFYGYMFVSGVATGDWAGPAMVAAATANFFLFFGGDVLRRMRRGHRRMQQRKQAIVDASEPFHRCSVCAITDLSHPNAEFRYAKENDAVVCYCVDHVPE